MRQTPSRDRLQIEWDLHEFGPRRRPDAERRSVRPAPSTPPAAAAPTAPRRAHSATLTEKVA